MSEDFREHWCIWKYFACKQSLTLPDLPVSKMCPQIRYILLHPSIHIHFRLRCSPCPIQWGWHIVNVFIDYRLWNIDGGSQCLFLDHGLALCTFIVLKAIKYLYSYSEVAHWHLYLDSDVLCWKRQINLITDIFGWNARINNLFCGTLNRHCETCQSSDIGWLKLSRTGKTLVYNHVWYHQNQAKIYPRSDESPKVFAMSDEWLIIVSKSKERGFKKCVLHKSWQNLIVVV